MVFHRSLQVLFTAALMLLSASFCFAQTQANSSLLTGVSLHSSTFQFTQKVLLWSELLPKQVADTALPASLASFKSWSSTERPYAYKVEDLAFFCRLEVQLEKATKIPVRFRIGDVQQVDYLEGKFEGWRYGY